MGPNLKPNQISNTQFNQNNNRFNKILPQNEDYLPFIKKENLFIPKKNIEILNFYIYPVLDIDDFYSLKIEYNKNLYNLKEYKFEIGDNNFFANLVVDFIYLKDPRNLKINTDIKFKDILKIDGMRIYTEMCGLLYMEKLNKLNITFYTQTQISSLEGQIIINDYRGTIVKQQPVEKIYNRLRPIF